MFQFSLRNVMVVLACSAVMFRVISATNNYRGELTDAIGPWTTAAALGGLAGAFVGRPIKWAFYTFAVTAFLMGLLMVLDQLYSK